MIKLYATLGPSCADEETLAAMLREGLDGFRLNLSHTDLVSAAPLLEALRAAADHSGASPELLIDLQGPELRVGALPEALALREGETVVPGEDFPLPEAVLEALEPGQDCLLDDGKLLLRMIGGREARVLRGGLLRSRKSVALPGREIRMPPLTGDDLRNLDRAAALGVSGVMQPFVRSAADLIALREALDARGGERIRIFPKIESRAGAESLEELLPHGDCFVIARGDLGSAVPLWELPVLQKRLAARLREAGKDFLVVTQLLASMEHSAVPTRAEMSDVCSAVLDGASALMLTNETAVGEYPAEAARYLRRAADSAEAFRREAEGKSNTIDFGR